MAETSSPAWNIESTGPVLVGYSGGLDSTVLLHLFSMQPAARERGLRAMHVHHGLHPDADSWAEHCRRFCVSLGVDLVVVHVRVANGRGQGPEAAARDARYAAFAEHLRGGETLVLAHHRDDQAETVLLRLLRASGSEGLSAMRATRPFSQGVIWRPLLGVSREALHEYGQAHDLEWIEDPSNVDPSADRNFLRHRVLPVLAERWPRSALALKRSADLLAEDAELLRVEANRRLAQVQGLDSNTLSVAALLGFEKPWRVRILRRWLSRLALPALPGQAVEIIESDLLQARRDAEPEYRWAGIALRRWRDMLHVERVLPDLPKDWRAAWNGLGALALPTGDQLQFLPVGAASAAIHGLGPGSIAADAAPTGARFQVTFRQGGERISLPGRDHSHALKKCLQEAGVPPWQRERLPLLLSQDGELLAAGDLIISARLGQFCREHSLRLHWQHAPAAADN